jgi:hypothetical protein
LRAGGTWGAESTREGHKTNAQAAPDACASRRPTDLLRSVREH